MAEPGKPRKHGILRTILVVLGALAALVVLCVVALLVLVDTDALASRVRDRVFPQLSERIGRDIRVGTIDAKVLPPSVRIDGVQVQGIGDQPLLAADSAIARPDIWTLVRSFGKEIRLSSIELTRPEANVVRLPNGKWSYEDILDRLKSSETPAQETGGARRQVSIDRATIEDGTLRVIDRTAAGGTATAELNGIDLTARNVGLGLPLAVEMRAALQSETPNVELKLDVNPLPADFAALGPGTYPQVVGSLQVNDAPLRSLRNLLPAGLSQVATGGLVRLSGDVTTEGDHYVAAGSGGVRELQLRGQPAEAQFGYTAQIDPATKGLQLAVRDLQVKGPGVDLGGTAQVQNAPMRFEFALAGPLLDLDTLMGVLPQDQQAQAERQPGAPVVPEAVRANLQRAQGHGTLQVDRLVSGKLTATDVKAEANLRGGALTLQKAQAQFYGGSVKADGTTANLAEPVPTWALHATMNGVDLGQAMQSIAGNAPVAGTLDSDVDLQGAGIDWKALREALTGAALLGLENGRLATLNLDQAVAGQLIASLGKLGQPATAGRIEKGVAGTPLEQLRTQVQVNDGWMTLRQPITVNTDVGALQLGGRIGLDWRLDLDGTVRLTPQFVSQVTGGKFRPSGPVSVPLQLGGTLANPKVGEFETEAVARALLPTGQVEQRVSKEVEKGKEKAKREAKKRAEDVLRGAF